MSEILMAHYEWLRAFHIISVIAWMAGLLYLPRLFVYHVPAAAGSDLSETLKIMERRLLRFIMNPAMILSWVFGACMLWANPAMMEQGWIHVKLTCVVLMTVYHHLLVRWMKAFRDDRNARSQKFFRIANEVPTLLMVVIVIMAVVQPF